MTDNT